MNSVEYNDLIKLLKEFPLNGSRDNAYIHGRLDARSGYAPMTSNVRNLFEINRPELEEAYMMGYEDEKADD